LGVPVFFTLSTGPARASEARPDAYGRENYIGELRILSRLMERYPDMLCSITHGFPWRVYFDGDRIKLPEEIWEPFENPNLSLEVCFPVRIGDIFDYPYREVWPTMEATVERIGLRQLMYGTDMPFQNRFCTYRQSRDWLERHFAPSVGLSDNDLSLIMGGTAARVLGVADG
ncbi:MAG: amidohydrolase family protein, partial [Chloroflexota bacterium]|nr:amidohydrolase family protein [Chloroflexota bacterium]